MKDADVNELKAMLGDVNLPSWLQFPDFERVGWFNLVIQQLWYTTLLVSAGLWRGGERRGRGEEGREGDSWLWQRRAVSG